MLRRLFLLAACVAATSAAAQTAEPDTPSRAPVDYLTIEHPALRAALDYAVAFGPDWLAENEVMAPFGLAITAPGVPNLIAVDDPALNSQQQLMVMVEMLRRMSQNGMEAEGTSPRPLTGAALAFDILTDVPGRPGKTDALCVVLEAPDVEGAKAYVLPYVRDEGDAVFLDPYLREQPPMLIVR